jgi:tripartite-type tricarboxylate transporter receptor subunit TctC
VIQFRKCAHEPPDDLWDRDIILAALIGFAFDTARSQDAYPTRLVRLIVGFAAGGSTDIPARCIAEKLTRQVHDWAVRR